MRLQTRLALLFGVVVTAAAAVMGALAYAAISQSVSASVDESLLAVSAPLARELSDDRMSGGEGMRGRGGDSGLALPHQTLLPNGTVVVADSGDVVLPVDAGDLAVARSASPAIRFSDVTIDARPYRVVAQSDGGARGAVQVGRDVTENVELLATLAWRLAVIGVAVAILAALAGWLLARRSASRLVELTDAAEDVTATGRLEATVPTEGSDEIARLGVAFSGMLAQLAQSRDDQQRLVQDAGHELRTPLTSLRTNVSLLRQFDAMPPETRERVIADLDGETRELTSLVNEVVHLAAASPADAPDVPVPLAPLARAVAERAYRRTGRTVSVVADGSVVLGQPAALERAVWNLVENACKFSRADTPIELVVQRGTVVVRDRGPGIAPADLPHVFDRFYRAADARALPGSGLGLAIVRDVAQAHGGRVFAANRPDGGAELGFTLPVQAEPTESGGAGT